MYIEIIDLEVINMVLYTNSFKLDEAQRPLEYGVNSNMNTAAYLRIRISASYRDISLIYFEWSCKPFLYLCLSCDVSSDIFASLDITPFLAISNNDMPVGAHEVPDFFLSPIQKVLSKLLHFIVPAII